METDLMERVTQRVAALNLSPRKEEIVWAVLAGKSNQEIRDTLFIERSTVRNHLWDIYDRAGVSNRDRGESTRGQCRIHLVLYLLGINPDHFAAWLAEREVQNGRATNVS